MKGVLLTVIDAVVTNVCPLTDAYRRSKYRRCIHNMCIDWLEL